MKYKPLVSIVAINYNNEKWVLETLNSISSQTYRNIEIIIVDDCSNDSSPVLIQDWVCQYSGIVKFIKHSENKGIAQTCNTGFNEATGDFISYIATDDIMLPNKTEIQVEILGKTGSDVAGVFSDAFVIDENGNDIKGKVIERMSPALKFIPTGYIYSELINSNFIPPMTVLLKRNVWKAIGGFDQSLRTEDRDFFLRLSRKYQLIYSDVSCIKYRERKDSVSKKIKFWDPENVKIFIKHKEHPEAYRKLKHYAKSLYFSSHFDEVNVLKDLKNDRTIWVSFFLCKYKIPKLIGSIIFKVLGVIDLLSSNRTNKSLVK